ncbi:hypothetical protein SAMN05216556_1521, partial [Aequorivita viscosa]|uniref:GEVED domain-containing protein n=1 Tax=Aequorivita viscosa TaxID=797419 RepID=UPI0008959D94
MKKKYKLILLFSLCVLISSGGTSQHRNSKSDKSHRTFSQPDSNRIFPSSTTKIISTSNKENVPFLNNNSSQNRLVYCEPNFSSCSSDHINKVIFAGINNDSECGTGHNDYTDQVGLVVTGETYTISVRNQALSSQNVFAYIDWNQNGILNDVGEVYTIANNAHHSGPHTQEITIPQDAVLGETRMRVVLQWNNTNANPCIVYGTGESEDYSLNVVDEIPNTPVNCSQLVPASNYGNGHFFMGQTNQKLAIDIDILPESTFEVNNVIIQTLDQATTFDLVFYDDDDGFPGTPFRTLNDVSIIEEIYLGTGTDYQYYKYTLDISSDAVQFEGEQLGRKVWMEVISDATAWNNTNNTALGSLGVFNNNNTDSWTITEVEFVYELIGNCTGSQIQDLPNNVCTNAIPFNCGNLVTGTTVGADDFGGNLSPDVFYSYTGSGQMENISLSLCSGTEFDTLIRVFSDCSLANEITFNDNFCGGQSVVNFISDGISTYYIMIEGGDTNSMGDFTLYASCTAIPAQNENPAQAIVLECGDRVQGSNVNASNTAGNPAGDVFYTYTGSGVAEDITISLCSIFTSYDTEIRVYDDISLSNLVGFADDDCGKFSQVTFYSDGETTYYIMIEGSEIEEG